MAIQPGFTRVPGLMRQAVHLLRPVWPMAVFSTLMGTLSGLSTAWLLAAVNQGLHSGDGLTLSLLGQFAGLCLLSVGRGRHRWRRQQRHRAKNDRVATEGYLGQHPAGADRRDRTAAHPSPARHSHGRHRYGERLHLQFLRIRDRLCHCPRQFRPICCSCRRRCSSRCWQRRRSASRSTSTRSAVGSRITRGYATHRMPC